MMEIDLDEAVPPAEEDEESGEGRSFDPRNLSRNHLIEIVSVVILSLASLSAAWAGYQATRWNGEQAELYSQASTARIESIRQSDIAHQLANIDQELFNLYAVAIVLGNDDLAEFQVRRFRDDFRLAFDAWMALDPLSNPEAPPSPFSMPEYVPAELTRANELDADAERLYADGTTAGGASDDYILATVFLAIVLFFVGISSRLDWLPARLSMIIIGIVILAVTILHLATLPVA